MALYKSWINHFKVQAQGKLKPEAFYIVKTITDANDKSLKCVVKNINVTADARHIQMAKELSKPVRMSRSGTSKSNKREKRKNDTVLHKSLKGVKLQL
jgi:hypothetical protein